MFTKTVNASLLIVILLFLSLSTTKNVFAQETPSYPHITQPVGPPPTVNSFEGEFLPNKIYLIPANPEEGFYWPYYVSTPKILKEDTPLYVEPNNDGLTGVPIESHHYWASILVEQAQFDYCRELGTFALIPVFPRPALDNQNGNLYVHALTRDVMTQTGDSLMRPDLQLLSMIEDAQAKIRSVGHEIPDKFMLWGFSAAGDFVTRMALLHPERLQCVVAGGLGGFPMLPEKKMNGMKLTYPVGVADFREISGKRFGRVI